MTLTDNNFTCIYSILRTIFFVENNIENGSEKKLNEILERWNLGFMDVSDEIQKNEKFELSKELENFSDHAEHLYQNLNSSVLSVLLADIYDLLIADRELSSNEKNLYQVLQSKWKDKLIDLNDLNQSMFCDDEFTPQNDLFALGYLFLVTMKIDGRIDSRELSKLRKNLKKWNNYNARVILASVNFCEASIRSNNLLKSFSNTNFMNEEIEKSIYNCARYLKKSTPKNLRKIMYDQIKDIIIADNKIHENEKKLQDILNSIWNDL